MMQGQGGNRGLPEDMWFAEGQQIACEGSICAFIQNAGGAWSWQIKTLAQDLADHGCKICGSVPIGFPGTNDVSQGQLTFNYVDTSKADCDSQANDLLCY
jgi:hypothetical protein